MDSPLMRLLPANYADGVYEAMQEPQLPNPRRISNAVTKGPSGIPSSNNRTVLSVFFEFGNARGNENVFIVAEGVIWFRYHNHLASMLKAEHPLWSDEELFQNARKWVIAALQNPNLKNGEDIDDLMMGMASQIAEREDNIVVEDLRDYMYGPMRFSRSDLVSLSIQSGRDNGLPSYNQAREGFGLKPVQSWEEINPELYKTNPKLFQELADLYGNDTSKLELFPGGLLESNGNPGKLFSAIILDQFERLRNGDRFWFQNTQNGCLCVSGDPCPQPRQLTVEVLHPCTNVTTFDYFEGSPVGFGFVLAVLLCFPLGSFLVAYLVAYFRKSKFKKHQKKQEPVNKKVELGEGITASEWQGPKEPLRQVSLRYDTNKWITVLDARRCPVRAMNLNNRSHLDIIQSNNQGQKALLVKIPKEYDLVLFFDEECERADFLTHLHTYMRNIEVALNITEARKQDLLKGAVTKQQRSQILDTFFRHAFAQVLDIEKSDAGDLNLVTSKKAKEALLCELTGTELAEALGLKADSLFVEAMFSLADKDGNGYLSFREFMDIIVIFMKGSPAEKSKLMFTMYDLDGILQATEVEEVIESMFREAGFQDKEEITWEDFHFLLRDHEKELQFAQLNVKDYALQADTTGIPETTMVGLIVSRGTAASISFMFSYMLLTMCRNLITFLRETFLNRYIPFDAAVDFHRWIAMSAIVLTSKISKETPAGLHCSRRSQSVSRMLILYLDGPFGEGHQEWNNYEVSVLVGGGIGVTPFASILKDLVFKSSINCKIQCKKIYFIWVTRTQRQFEWLADIIKEVEMNDSNNLVSVHIYITQLAEKFDLRTTMLYICERHFQKVLNRSLFTGLRAITHFGRPPFVPFFNSLQEVHPEVSL
ncbi:UNVERIFIED_CONTAM: hypothetical protein FKN15_062530 [Acipenser sinensis]